MSWGGEAQARKLLVDGEERAGLLRARVDLLAFASPTAPEGTDEQVCSCKVLSTLKCAQGPGRIAVQPWSPFSERLCLGR